MPIKAVVFDMDGVLIDSREFITRAIEDVLAARGLSTTAEQMAAVTGKPIHAMYEVFAPELDPFELEAAHIRHHDAHLHLLKAYEGTRQTLTGLRTAGYRLGLFTGSDLAMAQDRLNQFELTDYFDSIFGLPRYTKHKPDPEGLLLCLEELACSAAEAVYIGDGIGDMAAGRTAGMRATIGITHGFSAAADLRTAGADYIIDSLAPLPALLTTLAD